MNNRALTLVSALVLLLSVGAVSGVGYADVDEPQSVSLGADNDSRTKQFEGYYGVEYTATLNTSSDKLTVEMHNPTNSTREAVPMVVHVYDRRYNVSRITLSPGEGWEASWRLNDSLKIGRTNHSVSVYGLGENASAQFNFSKKIGTDNPERYPVPRIVDVELVLNPPNRTGLHLAVKTKNSGKQSYDTYIYVHTNKTESNRAPAGVPYGEEYHVAYVPLEENPEDRVVGEVRLYRGSVENDSGIRDQIYFEGRVDGETTIRNESFDPITPPYEENAYEFTPSGSAGSGGSSLSGDVLLATALAFGAVVGVSLVIGFLFKLR